MVQPLSLDERLKEWATPTQAKYLDAVNLHGGASAAARALGVHKAAVSKSIISLKRTAARQGYAPGHFADGVAPGYLMGKVTVQRGPSGRVERTWERQSPDAEERLQAMLDAAEAMAEDLPRVDPIERPASTLAELANLYVVTDYHFGMMAWHREGGEDWDLKIAEGLLMSVFGQMIASSPPARVGILAQLGDLLHADGLLPVTPTSGHVLDADGRFSKVVQVAIRCLRRVVDLLLMKHEEVHVIMAEGNHDIASSLWLRVMFAALYEKEPRVTINASELPYYVYQHGETMLAFHHGHQKKNGDLPLLFAAQFPAVWGSTRKRYAHSGHRHHEEAKEFSGMKVIQHPTLAARDAYSSRGGWISERQTSCITYHARHGKVGEVVVTPEMVAA